jgi:hypothetical protein
MSDFVRVGSLGEDPAQAIQGNHPPHRLHRVLPERPCENKASQAHHVFPQKFELIFSRKGINIHDPKFGSWWGRTSHLKNASAYNAEWEKFIRTNPSKSQIINFGRKLMAKYGLHVNF